VTLENATATPETDKGLLCFWVDDGVAHWIAKRHIASTSEVHHGGDSGKLIVGRWFASTAKLKSND
jgi:hypothetical protein